MIVPAFPIANLVVGEARFTLGALETFFNAMVDLFAKELFRWVDDQIKEGEGHIEALSKKGMEETYSNDRAFWRGQIMAFRSMKRKLEELGLG